MSDRAQLRVLSGEGEGWQLALPQHAPEEAQRLVDREVRRVVDRAHAHVSSLLRSHQEQLDALALKLLESEALVARDAYAAAGMPMRAGDSPVTALAPLDLRSDGRCVVGGRRGPRDLAARSITLAAAPAGRPVARRAHAGLTAGYLRELRTRG